MVWEKKAFNLAEQSDFTGLELKSPLQRYSHAAVFKLVLSRCWSWWCASREEGFRPGGFLALILGCGELTRTECVCCHSAETPSFELCLPSHSLSLSEAIPVHWGHAVCLCCPTTGHITFFCRAELQLKNAVWVFCFVLPFYFHYGNQELWWTPAKSARCQI